MNRSVGFSPLEHEPFSRHDGLQMNEVPLAAMQHVPTPPFAWRRFENPFQQKALP